MIGNKIIIIGNATNTPELRKTGNGTAVTGFTVAVNRRFEKTTDFFKVNAWRGLAEVAEKYVRKGARLYIEGKIKSRTYEDKMGNRRYITEIYAEDMQILTRPQTQDGQQPVQNQQYRANQYSAPAAQTFAQPAAPIAQPAPQVSAEPVAQPFIGAPSGMDENLPF